ncbi:MULTISPECIES: glycerophosphodiester phosphodiesterase family protein [unclassified Paracoccus (in: a-proteobacteria)]|nr:MULTISPECIES: glycerophosphodiester phosphodiesterase family protein [unclassified Paracoccus (in: a-proteobacteria)]MBB1492179.1 glycerophosphodiester phosphodiesterase [Paracoccus sp. MC1854]MBB1498597.1 glycerophosphodiester phosphodiesterase [Paracoccus sp. MC1862]QQO44149.1 glycerophosphodiester phosphodiesterase [Paracoccus sp. MC1862]
MSQIMAHRGARNLWAENSATGFRETARHGFDGIEFDLHLTEAGEIVVIHDPTLDRTTNGTGRTRDLTPESRKALRLRGPDGVLIDEGVPSLEEVLEILAPHTGTDLYVELKSDQNGTPYPGLVERTVETLRRFGLAERSILHGFDIKVVRHIRATAPDLRRLISVNRTWADRQGGIAAFLKQVDDLVDVVGIHHELFEAEFDLISRLRPLKSCSVWTINEPALIRRWIARAPGFLVSDNPVLLRELMQEGVPA